MMPDLSKLYIRTALVHLMLGSTLGMLILTAKAYPWWGWAWMFLPGHVDMLLFGWTLQLGMGVGYWMLPRYSDNTRGSETPIKWAYSLLNLGVTLVALAPISTFSSWTILGRVFEVAAIFLFVRHIYPRLQKISV